VHLTPFQWLWVLLIALGLVVPSCFALTFVIMNRISDTRTYVALALTTLFCFAVVATFGIIIAQGLGGGVFKLESSFIAWLGGATIGEIAGMLYIVIKWLFPSK
jgi:hypothetical protein